MPSAASIKPRATYKFRYPSNFPSSSSQPFICFACLDQFSDRLLYSRHLVSHYPTAEELTRLKKDHDLIKYLTEDMHAAKISDIKSVVPKVTTANPKQYFEEPFLFLMRKYVTQTVNAFQFSLVMTRGLTENDCLEITKRNIKNTLHLGIVYIFNTRNVVLLNDNKTLKLKPGESHTFDLKNDAIGLCEFNSILISYSTNDDGIEVYFEYHRLANRCCGQITKLDTLDMKALEREPNNILYNILKPKRNKYELDILLSKYKEPSFRLTVDNYTETMRMCCSLDEIERQLILNTYCRRLPIQFMHGNKVKIYIPNAPDTLSSLETYDLVVLQSPWLNKCWFPIFDIVDDGIVMFDNSNFIRPNVVYIVRFKLAKLTYNLEHRALDLLNDTQQMAIFFPTPADVRKLQRPSQPFSSLRWQNPDIACNEPQMQAVQHIVRRSAAPYPYLLFGPPGTGKTKTIVEAVYQLLLADSGNRILVCTNSNTAADELALRLRRVFYNTCPDGHVVYRIFSRKLVESRSMDGSMVSCSNWCRGAAPPTAVLDKYRVVVCTLAMAGMLGLRKVPQRFTDIIIDECGSAQESATLVAIVGKEPVAASIVLAGDPKQLGPVIKSGVAIQLGYEKSMLERLISTPVYAKDPITSSFDAQMVTKLCQNYRSHPAIIRPSNQLFYDSDLLACGPPDRTECFLNWRWLPNPAIPIVFHALTNTKVEQSNNTSWFNRTEVDKIVWYIQQLLGKLINGRLIVAADIGVITPYRLQSRRLSQRFAQLEWSDITVATVEKFQGHEKPIVLMSTVRSQQSIGFLCNEKRMNVMLTRAQALQIVVGDPLVLQYDRHWRHVLADWKAAGVCTGDEFELSAPGNHLPAIDGVSG